MFGIRTRIAGAAVVAAAAAATLSAVPATAAPGSSLPQVKSGDKGAYVLTLQAELNRAGYKLNGTGHYGPETKKMVVSWQKKNHIKASGIVGPKTWQSLSSCGMPNPEYLRSQSLTPGQKLNDAQWWLLTQDLGWVEVYFPSWGSLPDPAVNQPTHYDARYVRVVKELQKRSGIKASGIIGSQTTQVIGLLASTQDKCVG